MTGAGAASAEQVEAAWEDNKLAQVLYHDWEAQTYDEKWSISFDDRCTSVVRDRFLHVLESTRQPGESLPYGRTLELGAGTGRWLCDVSGASRSAASACAAAAASSKLEPTTTSSTWSPP